MKASKNILFSETNDFAEFHSKVNSLPFNRTAKVVPDLVINMNKNGFTTPILLIKTNLLDGVDKLYIADGHNRAMTAIYLKMPITATLLINKFENVEDLVDFVASHNNSQKAWVNFDYIKAFAYVGKKDYLDLIRIKSKYPYSITIVASMLYGTSRFNISNAIKKGSFTISKLKETVDTMTYAAELSKYKSLTNRMIISLYNVMRMEIFNKKKFTNRYIKYIDETSKMNLDTFEETFISWLK